MKINKTDSGYEVIPETHIEEKHLDWLLDAIAAGCGNSTTNQQSHLAYGKMVQHYTLQN